ISKCHSRATYRRYRDDLHRGSVAAAVSAALRNFWCRGQLNVQGVGAVMGEVATEGDARVEGEGDGDCTSSARNALKSELLITKAPSSSSVRAIDVPSGEDTPIASFGWALSAGE